METAYLSNSNNYTIFSFKGTSIKFLTSKKLEKYTSVKEWNNGYLVVMAKNHNENEHEEYIDLLPILKNLYMDPKKFLKDIKGVEIKNV